MNPLEIGWVAGLIEGEGSIGITNKKYTRMAVGMSDRDIIERLQRTTGVGRIHTQKRPSNRKDIFFWSVCRRPDVLHLLCSVVPLLGERRRQQVMQMLDANEGVR